jgi:membrane dipeptidase
MKLYDGHSDIWYDVMLHSEKGERDIFRKYHLNKFQKGGVFGGTFVVWIDPPHDEDPVARVNQIEVAMKQEMQDSKDILNIVKTFEDFDNGTKAGKINAVVGLEGLSFIGEDIDKINYYYDEIFARTMQLTWNEENPLASGWPGDKNRGLTEKGREAIQRMNSLGVVIDVSHINDKGFWDIISLSDGKPIIASHSNVRTLSPHMRNLSDDMIKAIAETGGVIGMNQVGDFISPIRAEQTVDGLAKHAEYIADMVGVEHIACGFDFEDFVETTALLKTGTTHENKEGTQGLHSAKDASNFLLALERRGFSQEDIEKIAYKNLYRVYENVLK